MHIGSELLEKKRELENVLGGDMQMIDATMDPQEVINREDIDMGQAYDSGEADEPMVRPSNRKSRQLSLFANKVSIGLGIRRVFHSDTDWENLNPIKFLPEENLITMEHNVTPVCALSRQKVLKLKEISFLDRMSEGWDPHPEIEAILHHRYIRHTHRILMNPNNIGPTAAMEKFTKYNGWRVLYLGATKRILGYLEKFTVYVGQRELFPYSCRP
jgi:hypothetical protein